MRRRGTVRYFRNRFDGSDALGQEHARGFTFELRTLRVAKPSRLARGSGIDIAVRSRASARVGRVYRDI